ncbi:MAG: hypothetical protein BWX79_01247 [Alphaproteobacteria bacterium ADurb.Bin100]|nr:MAG: hypothetical protein BWX79_01247 [Alphaproteobacteria bacterium ADurb.Bin100]
MPGRSSPRMAITRLGAGLGGSAGAAACTSASAGAACTSDPPSVPVSAVVGEAGISPVSIADSDPLTLGRACFCSISAGVGAIWATTAAAWACPRRAASSAVIAALIFWASPLALAASRALAASSTTRSRWPSAWSAFSRSCVLRLKASSIGLRNASHNFCSDLRSIGTLCASACQRCCNAFTASMRSTGAAPSTLASSIMAWRRSRLSFCAASNGAAAAWMVAFHSGCNSAKAFSLRWPASRQRSENWCNARENAFHSWGSVRSTLRCVQALSSSISAMRCALCAAASALSLSSQTSTTLCASLQASSKRFHRAWLGTPPWSTVFHCSRSWRNVSCILRPPMTGTGAASSPLGGRAARRGSRFPCAASLVTTAASVPASLSSSGTAPSVGEGVSAASSAATSTPGSPSGAALSTISGTALSSAAPVATASEAGEAGSVVGEAASASAVSAAATSVAAPARAGFTLTLGLRCSSASALATSSSRS